MSTRVIELQLDSIGVVYFELEGSISVVVDFNLFAHQTFFLSSIHIEFMKTSQSLDFSTGLPE